MATIDPGQDYDMIHTLTFAAASGTCAIRLYRGSSTAFSGTVYYRAGTSGDWTRLNVSGTGTTFPVTSTTMQVGHSHNKNGNDYMTVSFFGQSANLIGIAISQKAVFSGIVGSYFMYNYAGGCSSLTSLSVPDTSGLTTAGTNFMRAYAYGCSSLTSLSVPDTSGLTTVGDYFMAYYADGCSSLTSLSAPDTSGLTTAGTNFMRAYAGGCSSLTSLSIPVTSGLTTVGTSFMVSYAQNCLSLIRLELPAVGWFSANNVSWWVESVRLGYVKGYVKNSTDLAAWRALTVDGKTLYTNYIRDPNNVILEGGGAGRLISGPGRHPLISGPGQHPLISCGGHPLIG